MLGAGGAARAIVGWITGFGRARDISLLTEHLKRAEATGSTSLGCQSVLCLGKIAQLRCLTLLCWLMPLRLVWGAARRLIFPSMRCLNLAVVYDIVYVPLETPLLAAARARGNVA